MPRPLKSTSKSSGAKSGGVLPERKAGACLARYAVFFAQAGVEEMYMTLL